MKRIIKAYREVIRILWQNSPKIVILTLVCSVINGILPPLTVWVNGRIFNLGLAVAAKEISLFSYLPYLGLFVLVGVLPIFVGDVFLNSYIMPHCRLILRTVYKGKCLHKLKRLRYEHMESPDSSELIDKNFHRIEETVLSLFPSAIGGVISAAIASAGMLWMLGRVRWWLLAVLLIPFGFESWFAKKFNKSIYDEMEGYWKEEKSYEQLGKMLRLKDYVIENRLLGASKYLIAAYQQRMKQRNQSYERFFVRHLRKNFAKQNLTRLSQLAASVALLLLFIQGEIDIGTLISLTLAVFGSIFSADGIPGLMKLYRTSGQYAKTFSLYDQYFDLSEDGYGGIDRLPERFDIQFENVSFAYPGTDRPILKEASFQIASGERVLLVGANGEGKSTLVKLLLGLFTPDAGEILIGGKPLSDYSMRVRQKMFGPVFQDFNQYHITFAENVAVGDIEHGKDAAALGQAMKKAKADEILKNLPQGKETLLGSEFEGGVDLSGGQWQRIAIARAFMGDKPVLILDEPTSQIDPVAERDLFAEFAKLSEGKTALFVSHRLGAASICDRILVLSGGRMVQSGTHRELLAQGGLYADMFEAQKQWYLQGGLE